MPLPIPPDIPKRTKWCQICGEYYAAPCDVVRLRDLLERNGTPNPDAPGQAHPQCFANLEAAVEADEA